MFAIFKWDQSHQDPNRQKRRNRWMHWNTLGCILFWMGACSHVPPQNSVSVFRIVPKGPGLKRDTLEVLDEQVQRCLSDDPHVPFLFSEDIRDRLPKKQRTVFGRCHELDCQLQFADEAHIRRVMSFHIDLTQAPSCLIEGSIYRIPSGKLQHRAISRGGCTLEDLRKGVQRVSCFLASAKLGAAAASPDHVKKAQNVCMAKGDFFWLERTVKALFKAASQGNLNVREAAEHALAERVLELKGAYESVMRYKEPQWEVAALCRIGYLYDQLGVISASNLKEAAANPSSIAEAMSQRVRPLSNTAITFYKQCLRLGKLKEVNSPYQESASERIQLLER